MLMQGLALPTPRQCSSSSLRPAMEQPSSPPPPPVDRFLPACLSGIRRTTRTLWLPREEN